MAIGTTAAIIGGSLLAAGGSALAAGSQARAADRASDAQVQASRENNALQREIYGRNEGNLSPFMQRGNVAGAAINDLLGLGGTANAAPRPMPNALGGAARGYGVGDGQTGLGSFGVNPRVINPPMDPGITGNPGTMPAPVIPAPGTLGTGPTPLPATPGTPAPVGTPATGGTITPTGAQNTAFDNFRNSTGYQFRLGEGMNAMNSGLASTGVLQSGAALLEAQRYGQNFASNEFGNYMGYLGQQQAVGAGAASSLAGVGQNFANSVSQANNDAAGAIGNAALIRGQNNPFANALGQLGGGLMQWGMR